MDPRWPESEDLTPAEVARADRDSDELMRRLLFNPPDDDGEEPEGGVREPKHPDDAPPPLSQRAAEPDDG